MSNIIFTNDYSIFKVLEENRAIDKCLVKRLIFSIEKNNLLKFKPILVTAALEVVDGQHRLEVAKKLLVGIYYQVQEDSNSSDLILLNAYSKNWNYDDYLNYYVKKGNPNYIRMEEMCKKYTCSSNHLLGLINPGRNAGCLRNFKNGSFKFDNVDAVINVMALKDKIISFIEEKIPWDVKRYVNSIGFLRAVGLFFSSDSVDIDFFLHKLNTKLSLLRTCTNVKDYIICFQGIYNYKNHSPVDILNEIY